MKPFKDIGGGEKLPIPFHDKDKEGESNEDILPVSSVPLGSSDLEPAGGIG